MAGDAAGDVTTPIVGPTTTEIASDHRRIAMPQLARHLITLDNGHEVGLASTLAAHVLGACMIERHITLDRAMWGSDQAASVEPLGFQRIVRDVHAVDGGHTALPQPCSGSTGATAEVGRASEVAP